ncbi:hypothetical protein ACXWR7_13915, partial [Streptococcus pyogenes]
EFSTYFAGIAPVSLFPGRLPTASPSSRLPSFPSPPLPLFFSPPFLSFFFPFPPSPLILLLSSSLFFFLPFPPLLFV